MQELMGLAYASSGLNRAAHLRKDQDELQAMAANGGQVLPLWRGRPLAQQDALVWLAADHPVLADAGLMAFLGLDGATPRFAADLSNWAPPADALAASTGFFDNSRQTHPLLPDEQSFVDMRSLMTTLSPREGELVAIAKGIIGWHQTHRFCAACGQASTVVMGGWQRSCPSCGASHFPRTDPVVIMLVTDGNRLLLGRSPAWPERMYSCLAGFVEPGETIEAAVAREVFEETSVQIGAVRVIASQPWPFPASLMIGCIATAISTDITVDPEEIEHALWVSREDLIQVFAGTHPQINPPRKGPIAQLLIENWLAGRIENAG